MVWQLGQSGLILVLWMLLYPLGGQIRTWIKRFLLPASLFAVTLGISFVRGTNHILPAVFLLYIPIEIMGQGEKSLLAKWLKQDGLVRAATGFISAMPILIYGLMMWKVVAIVTGVGSLLALPLLYEPNLGSWGTVKIFGKDCDILGSDFLRAGSIAILWSIVLW